MTHMPIKFARRVDVRSAFVNIHVRQSPKTHIPVSILPLESIKNHSSGLYAPYKKPTQIFGNVRCPILGKPSAPLCGLADRHEIKADLNWKLKISNTADNADITQSQARDTRHRRIQEVNSLCTDSGPLQAKYCIVGIQHNIAI